MTSEVSNNESKSVSNLDGRKFRPKIIARPYIAAIGIQFSGYAVMFVKAKQESAGVVERGPADLLLSESVSRSS